MALSLKSLVLRYTAFAVVATLANLGTQRLVLMAGDTLGILLLAIAAGTLVGLVIKYLLDKRWIFQDMTQDKGQQFALYTTMGLVTTAIFWGTETAFWFIWRTDLMREVGAILGLAVGYVVKYRLDRRFVFTDARMRLA